MEWSEVAQALFFCGWSCIGIYVAGMLKRLNDSVTRLHTAVEVLVVKHTALSEEMKERKEEIKELREIIFEIQKSF